MTKETTSQKLLILAIDDEENEVKPTIPKGFECIVIDPNESEKDFVASLSENIDRAKLILLDQEFRGKPASLSLTAHDGASFVAHLRSWARRERRILAPIVMFTNKQDAFANETPSIGAAIPLSGSFIGREHRLAPTLDVEWIQFKDCDNTTERLSELTQAFIGVCDAGGTDGISLSDLSVLLQLNTSIWEDRAREELRHARPPINEVQPGAQVEPARGPAQVVRWLCQRALPYPGVFLSDTYAAWTLGISKDAFGALATVAPETEWLTSLRGSRYVGPLENFMGRRWWRAGVDQLAWELDEKASDRKSAFHIVAPTIDIGEVTNPSTQVVVWNSDFQEAGTSPLELAIPLHPPGWPAEALEPWVLREEVEKDPVLLAMADAIDLG